MYYLPLLDWYYLGNSFKFHPVCNGCHDLSMMPMNISGIAILNIASVDYLYIINGISKREVVNSPQNCDLSEKSRSL